MSYENTADAIVKVDKKKMKEPDLIQDSVHHSSTQEVEYGSNFKKLRITDNVRELQTVLRDK